MLLDIAKLPTAENSAIHLNPADNVAIARVPLARVRSNGAFFSPELLITLRHSGMRIRQVGVRHFPRTAGEEKGATPRVVARAIRDLFVLRARFWSGRAS